MPMIEPKPGLRELFEAALALPIAQRAAWLGAHCAGPAQRAAVERMLASDAAENSGALDGSIDELLDRVGDCESALPPPDACVGPFRLCEKLGEGGSSIVFRATREQAGVNQVVALKLLRRGLYTSDEQRRFRDERRALTQLRHPGIARLIEGGLTDAGVPYIALELVEGLPITQYAQEHHLDLRARLRLFVDICRAVAAAHRALIVHRDLKPSNVLVTGEGEIKLLDFGIAKLLDAEDDPDSTRTQLAPMTPAYAAPEQFAHGQITTATDVYALGILLDELITGVRRAHGDARTPSSRVSENTAADALPASARTTRRQLRGDLDNIVLKATASEPERRYASAGALADDIERHMQRQPVVAHPPSRWYRARKFVARHRGGVATTVLFLLAILASLGLALWQADVARDQAMRANTVRDFVLGTFDAARAHLPRDQRPTPEALVEQAQRKLSANSSLDAVTRGDMLRTLGEVSLSLSNFAQAQTLFAEASALATEHGDAAGARAAQVLHDDALQRAGHNDEALHELQAMLDDLRAKPTPALLRAYAVLASAEMATGQPDAAIAHRRDAAAAAEHLYGANSTEALAVAFEVGNTLSDAQRYPQAIAALGPLLTRWRTAHAPEDDRYVAALGSLAGANDGIGDLPAGEARFRELLALKQRIYTAPHDAIASTLRDLGTIVARAERYPEAQALLDQALAMQRQVFGENHREVAATYDALGEVMVDQRRFADADANYRAAIGICERTQIKEEVCPRARNNLGQSQYRQGRFDDAKREMTLALAERRALFGNDHPTVAYSLSTLANVAVKQNDAAQAVRLSADALGVLERDGHAASREDAQIRNGYAQALWLARRNDEALPEIERALIDWQRVAPDGKSRHVVMLVQKALILRDLKRSSDARVAAEEAIAVGAAPSELPETTRELLRQLSGNRALYPETVPATQL